MIPAMKRRGKKSNKNDLKKPEESFHYQDLEIHIHILEWFMNDSQ